MNRSPAEVFTNARDADASMSVILEEEKEVRVLQLAEEVVRTQKDELERMYKDVDDLHKGIRTRQSAARRKAADIHNRRTKIRDVDSTIGDYVLVGIAGFKKQPKLSLRWTVQHGVAPVGPTTGCGVW